MIFENNPFELFDLSLDESRHIRKNKIDLPVNKNLNFESFWFEFLPLEFVNISNWNSCNIDQNRADLRDKFSYENEIVYHP